MFAHYQELQNFEIYHLNVEKSDITLPYTPQSDKFVCSPAEMNHHDHHQSFVSILLEEPLSAFCPAMSIFGNMAPVWTYSLIKVILPMSFWMTIRPLLVSWAPLCCIWSTCCLSAMKHALPISACWCKFGG